MAFFQMLGIASIVPFIALVMEPDLVLDNEWLLRAYHLFNFQNPQSFIIAVGVAMLLIIVSSNAISALGTWLKLKFVWHSNHRLSCLLLQKYLSSPYPFFLNKNSAELTNSVLGEVKHLTSSFMLPLLMLVTSGLSVIFIMVMLFIVDIIVSLVAVLVLGGAYAVIFLSINKQLTKRGTLRIETNIRRYKVVGEAFGGIKEIKVVHRENYFLKEFSKASLENVRHQAWNVVVSQMPKYALETLAFGGIILFVIILLLRQGDVQQVVPIIALFALAGYRLMPAFQQIFNTFTEMQFNQEALNRIYRDITEGEKDDLPFVVSREALPEPLPFQKEIRLQNITYYYPNTQLPVVADLNLVIQRNTSVALVGITGAGKTTLADIILGLLVPQKGAMLIDGLPVDEKNVLRWQLNLGYVPQQIYLKDDTVANNIAFGLKEKAINQETLEKVARIANIYDFITQELPKGFDTMVGERGIRLSGGQRQRIGIARALYHDPEVMVFDEATSALDGMTEDAVLHAMENAARLKTLVIIAHRLTTVKNCDAIYLIDKGKIVDSGTYEELLEKNPQFRSMAKVRA